MTTQAGWLRVEAQRLPFIYTQAGSAALLYPRVGIGSGFDSTIDSAANQGLSLGSGSWYLDEVDIVAVNNLGSTTITLVTGAAFSSFSTLATCTLTLAAGPNRIRFRSLAGAHVIVDNRLVGIGIDPTSNHGQICGTAVFRSA